MARASAADVQRMEDMMLQAAMEASIEEEEARVREQQEKQKQKQGVQQKVAAAGAGVEETNRKLYTSAPSTSSSADHGIDSIDSDNSITRNNTSSIDSSSSAGDSEEEDEEEGGQQYDTDDDEQYDSALIAELEGSGLTEEERVALAMAMSMSVRSEKDRTKEVKLSSKKEKKQKRESEKKEKRGRREKSSSSSENNIDVEGGLKVRSVTESEGGGERGGEKSLDANLELEQELALTGLLPVQPQDHSNVETEKAGKAEKETEAVIHAHAAAGGALPEPPSILATNTTNTASTTDTTDTANTTSTTSTAKQEAKQEKEKEGVLTEAGLGVSVGAEDDEIKEERSSTAVTAIAMPPVGTGDETDDNNNS